MELTLVCAKCSVAANGMSDGSIKCPQCGATGDSRALEEANRVAAGQFQHDAAGQVQDMFAKAFRNTRHVTYKRGRLPSRPGPTGLALVYVPSARVKRSPPRDV